MGYTVGKVSPPLKRLFKGPPPSFPGFHLLGWQGYSKEQSPPRSRVYRRVHTDRSDPITRFRFEKEDAQVHRRRKSLESTQPDQQNLVSRKHGRASGSQNLVFGKIKDAPSPSQPVGAWVEKTECNSRCNGPGTVAGMTRFQVPLKRTGLKGDFLSCQDKFFRGKWQAHLDKYLKLMPVEMLGWYPGLKKIQKVNFIEGQRPKDKREFLPLNSSSSATW